MARTKTNSSKDSTAHLGFEAKLWLAPQPMAGLNAVRKDLANGSMSSNQSGDCNARSARRNWAANSQGLGSQRDIRRALIEADLVDCMVALPGQLFYSTQIPVCLGFRGKNNTLDSANDAPFVRWRNGTLLGSLTP